MFKKIKIASRLAAGIAIAASITFPAFADVNLEGKTVEFVIPFSETGGSAKWANFFAPLLSEQLPGKPTVIVKFMAGAGSVSYTHLRAHETDSYLVCRLLLEKKKKKQQK